MNLMADLGPDEREVLAVFERFGQEGRAISTESLAVHAGLKADRKRLSTALQTLAGKGFIKEAGGNPFSNARAAPADGILAAHCRPNGNSAPPFKRQLWTKYIAPRGRGSHTQKN
jgi:hypothetical protein